MKKVMVLANYDGGIYNFRYELLERLVEEGHDVVISAPAGDRTEDLVKLGCRCIDTDVARHGTNPMSDIGLFLTYLKILKKEKPDIVFSYTIKPNIYGAMACGVLNIPCVANITGLGSAVENGGIMQKLTVTLYKMAFVKVKRVFFQNTENMHFFSERKIALGKHALLPGSGVNLNKFSLMDYPDDSEVHFAFISRVMKEKGVDQYLETAEIIKKKYPNTVFHVCGFCEEDYEKQLSDLQEENVIVYHGLVKNIREILRNIHCVVHPTYYPEGLSNVLLEASATGRAIITTNRSGCREVIDDGVNGYITEQKNTADLAEKVERFINLPYDLKKEMGLMGRKKVSEEFDRQIVVNAYMKELESIGERDKSVSPEKNVK